MKQLLPVKIRKRTLHFKQLLTAGTFLFFMMASNALQAQSYNWGNVTIGGGGFVSAIIPGQTEEGLIYARTDVGGAYRWDGENERWIPLLDWVSENETSYLGVESLAIDPTSPNKLYLQVGTSYWNGGKTAILRSDDYGQTFSVTEVTDQFRANGNGMGRQTGEKLAVDANSPNILFTGTGSNGLFKSTDSGETWSRVDALDITATPNGNGISFVVLDSLSSDFGTPTQTIFAGVSRTGDNLYRSDDGGETFTAVTGGPAGFMPQRAVLDNAGNLYITYANGAGPHGHWEQPEPFDAGRVMKYNTETGAWTDITPFSNNRPYGGISVDPENANRIITSTINTWLPQGGDGIHGDRFFLSTDGGATWTDVVARGHEFDNNGFDWIEGGSIHWAGSIEFDPFNTDKVWVTSGNGIFTTDDINAEPAVWEFTVKGLEETVPINLVSIPDGPVVSVILDYDGFVHNDINQPGSMHKPSIGSTQGLAVAAKNPDVMLRYVSKEDPNLTNWLYYTEDGGATWNVATDKGRGGQVAVSADGEVFLHAPEGSRFTFRSEDLGASWSVISGLNFTNTRPVADPENSDKFYVYNPVNGRVYVSTDKGVSFAAAGTPGTGGSKKIATVHGHEGHLWVALYGGGLVRSTDSGASFQRMESVSSAAAVGVGKEAEGSDYPTLFIWGTVNGQTGMHMSVDQGQTWMRINDDAHEYGGLANGQFVVGDWNVFGRVYMSTAGRGIVYGEPACDFSIIQPNMRIAGGEGKPGSTSMRVEAGQTAVLSPAAAGTGTWQWTGPAGFSATGREISLENISADQAGTYTVSFTGEGGCESPARTFTIAVDPVTGLGKDIVKNSLVVYPNPSEGTITISLPEPGYTQMQIIDLKGKAVYQRSLNGSVSQLVVETELQPGVYSIQLRSNKNMLTSKVVIK